MAFLGLRISCRFSLRETFSVPHSLKVVYNLFRQGYKSGEQIPAHFEHIFPHKVRPLKNAQFRSRSRRVSPALAGLNISSPASAG